ncbi:hypothetical protein EsH8_VI_000791 [Colletotrichum jinshuiense]
MKFQAGLVPTFAALLQVASAASPIQVEVRYSKEMIDVGNLNLGQVVWDKIYAEPGNERAIVTDTTYPTTGNKCTTWAKPVDNDARVVINGAWGRIPDLGPHDSREALVASLVKVLEEVTNPTGWRVFSNCYGLTWQESVPAWKGPHACGGLNPTVSENCLCDSGMAQCEFHTWAHQVPSVIKANLYRDGVLLADNLEINFSSKRRAVDSGCGTVGQVVSAVVGFLPMPGPLFATGLGVFCS